MYKFKVSKYKNAAPKIPKKEQCITEIPMGQIMASFGNFLQASGKHIVFNVESGGGGCAGILPLDAVGRRNRQVPTIYAHSDFLSDMCFNPFDDDILATCSHDGSLKIWRIPEDIGNIYDQPMKTMRLDEEVMRRIDLVRFNPVANQVLSSISHNVLHVMDIDVGETKFTVELDNDTQFMSMDWKLDGKILITSCKDTNNRVLDPRAQTVSMTFPGFAGVKESRMLWLGDLNYIFGAGFSKQRSRVIKLWDIRNTNECVNEEEIDQGSGSLMTFHDIDTNLIMIAGKGDTNVKLFEFNQSTTEVSFSSSQSLAQQSFGMGMTPKRVLDVMNGEVNRLYQLSKNMITPLPYIIPRKSYRDFQPDLFPDTVYSGIPSMSAAEWSNGEDKEVIKLSLDPKKPSAKPVVKKAKEEVVSNPPRETPKLDESTTKLEVSNHEKPDFVEKKRENGNTVGDVENQVQNNSNINPVNPNKTAKKISSVFSNNSKFRHLHAEPMHKKNNIENVKNLSESLPSESDPVQSNKDLVAVPLHGSGGQIAVFQLSKPGRLPESNIPVLVNSCNILDFAMDPFDNRNIAVACEDWQIRLWEIPKNGLTETCEEPKQVLKGHKNRVSLVKYHPTASNILVSASFDHTVRVWDLTDFSEIGALEGHTDQILCLDWHPDGSKLVTVCRDKKIRIYEPVDDLEPMAEGNGPDVVRGARVCWCGPGNNWLMVSSSFGSERGLFLYDSEDFSLLASTDNLGESPSVLSLHYDESSSIMFASGKGERIIYIFEISEKAPYLVELSQPRFADLHQGVRFLQKNVVDVRHVEFARAIRLTKTYIELVSFKVPRVKDEFFQDDIFPSVRVTWEPALTAEEWLDGGNASQVWISLKPNDMTNLSEAPQEAPKEKKYISQDILSEKTDDEKKKELIDAMMKKLDIDDKLEQDDFEGVDEDEWDD